MRDIRSDGVDIKISHNIKPRDKLQERAMKYMLTHTCGILQLNPGAGKTVIAIHTIAELKKRALILVHRESLVDQWMGEIYNHTDLPKDEAVRLTSSNFSEAFDKSIIVATNQTFVSLLRNHREDFLKRLNRSEIGVFIGDEVHTTVGAPVFAECSIHIPAKIVFGLSATPYRYDGNGDIIEYHLGEIYTDEDSSGAMKSRVMMVLFDYGIVQRSARYVYWGGDFQRSRYLNLIKKSNIFQGVVRGFINKYKDERNIIIVAERIKLIEELYDWLDSDSKSKFIRSAGNDQLDYRVTFATPMKIRDGVNIPQKDCLILTSPVSNIDQMSGRITRTFEGKQEPIIIDMVDLGCREICRTVHNRMKFYKSKDWDINYMIVNSRGSSQPLDDDEFHEIIEEKWGSK